MAWRFSFYQQERKDGQTRQYLWFDGASFVAATKALHQSGLSGIVTDEESALIVADQLEDQNLVIEADTIRRFIQMDARSTCCLPQTIPANRPVNQRSVG